MKYTYIATAIPLFLLGSMAVNAASSTELKVGGELTSKSACNVIAGSGGVFELGKIDASTAQDKDVALSSSEMLFHIKCDEKTQVNFQFIDNKAGTNSTDADAYFGLGTVNGTGKLGYYTLTALNGSVDGHQKNFYITQKISGSAPHSIPILTIHKGMFNGWVDKGIDTASGNDFRFSLKINPWIASKDKMNGPLTEGVRLDGSATINLFYGI